MAEGAGHPSATELVGVARRDLADVEREIRSHRFFAALAEGRVPCDGLGEFAGEQYAILSSDRRSFAVLAGRFPQPPPGDLFLTLAVGEGQALGHLVAFAGALGLDEEALRAHEPDPRARAYPAFVAWLALNGSRADVALALLANLAAWGANCAHMARALRERYELDDQAVAFFDFFAQPSADIEQRSLAVLDAGLHAGNSPSRALRAARLLQAYELLFWDAVAEGIT
jgi:thiaminase